MSATPKPFTLYDEDIHPLLLFSHKADLTPFHTAAKCAFEPLQESDLIWAIAQKNYPKAYCLLRKLDHTLSPSDAIAACLCALGGTPRLMHTLLDHCPPIPEFQFQGVGKTASLLNVVVQYHRDAMLDLLLERGADPNGGPTPLTAATPLEVAFCHRADPCLKRLLAIPGLPIQLTEPMLEEWGALALPSPPHFLPGIQLPCCRLMMEKLTGQVPDPKDLLPVPPQLRLGHALRQINPALAVRICETRTLTEADKADVLAHYTMNPYTHMELLYDDFNEHLIVFRRHHAQLLLHFLAQFPETLNTPEMRFAVASTIVALPEPHEGLLRWAERLEPGPIPIGTLPHDFGAGLYDAYMETSFFPRWDARLGSRLIPSMDIHADMQFRVLTEDGLRLVLERVHFMGESTEALSSVAKWALDCAPKDTLPKLLQPGNLLAREHPDALFDACQTLPAFRRGLILSLIHREVNFSL